MSTSRRFSRQSRLAEIGPSGQSKLCTATVGVRSRGFAEEIERRYVLRAGMQEATSNEAATVSVDLPADALVALGLRHGAAREVAEGALRALVAIRSVVLE
jgi:hypothetical protein